ncbi:tax1-binding protein 1 homolog [Cylas formicarius]|uniref:tax1-binding protein 1 homolog n=1 Tax=Cylas formicarius TaxID=197179 RepID=UPI0029583CD5|nr:tax1-binding protein 1 homolog [Cylas formicarius]
MAAESLESKFTSLRQAVEFVNVADQYPCNKDLFCKYKLNDYRPQEGDRVAIFKLGWNFVKDYLVFEWAPVSPVDDLCSVTFNQLNLPKSPLEIYQLCYIGAENEVHGASSPFSFCGCGSASGLNTSQCVDRNDVDKDMEICRLREENAILKQSLKAILGQEHGGHWKAHDSDIKELKRLVEEINSKVVKQQAEIDTLKGKIRESGEEYRKLYLEKAKVEKKYEKLKVKKVEKTVDNFDIGDLKSIPPFPSFVK